MAPEERVTEPRLKTEHLYREGKIADALNAFIEAEIDLERDGGPVLNRKASRK